MFRMKVLELGIKEGQLATLHSFGIAVYKDTPRINFSVYITLPLAVSIKLNVQKPLPPGPAWAGSKWWWLEVRFSWYRFFKIEIGLPLWRSSKYD